MAGVSSCYIEGMRKLVGTAAALSLSTALAVGVMTPANAVCYPSSVAHRGGTEKYTENTRKAWNNAMANGAKWVETDVRFTTDGVPVIMHDVTVDRTTNGAGQVSTMTLAQIRSLRTADGQYVPTLYEFLSDVKAHGDKAFVELKVVPTDSQWTAFKARFDWLSMRSSSVITSFEKNLLVSAKAKGFWTGWIDELGDRDPAEITPYATYYLKHHWSVTTARYKKWTAAGLKVFPWTVNQTSDWSRFDTMGVPGVITDKPNAFNKWVC